jgi:cytochrome P450/NADPH-cytochrome P450 reductase
VAKSLLFFGCDHPDVDFLYSDELAQLQAGGLVDVRPAFYEQPHAGVRFVQHRLWEDRGAALALYRQGASVYVCGDGRRMAPAVRQTWRAIFAEMLGGDEERAASLLAEADRDQRYLEDIFA